MSTLKITGMTCDSCAVHVKDALEKVPGVQSADVSYAKGSAKLAIEVGTSPDALTAAVAGLGYRATLADAPSVSTPGGLLEVPLNKQQAYAGRCHRPTPVAEQLAAEVMSLPMSADLQPQEQDAILHALRSALG